MSRRGEKTFSTRRNRRRRCGGFWASQKSGNLSSTGRKGVCGKPGKGVLHEDDPHFSELFEALKNASAWRKDFFATLKEGRSVCSGLLCLLAGKHTYHLIQCSRRIVHIMEHLRLHLFFLGHHGVPCLCTELISSLCVFRPVKAASASGRSE